MKLCIPIKIWQQIKYYVEASGTSEVTGIGTIIPTDDGRGLSVEEIFLPKQIANPSACQFAEGALHEIIYQLMKRDPDIGAVNLRFRWHSHAGGSVFWSSIDVADIRSWQGDWAVNLVVNNRGDYLARLDIFKPLQVENIPLQLEIIYPDDEQLRAKCQVEITNHVEPGLVKTTPFTASDICQDYDLQPPIILQLLENVLKGGGNL